MENRRVTGLAQEPRPQIPMANSSPLEPTPNATVANFRVLTDHVLLKEIEPPEKIGSIIVPDIAKDNQKRERGRRGIVVKVGPGFWHKKFSCFVPTTVKPDDHVIFTGQGTREVVLDGVKHLIMHEGLIQLVIEGATEVTT